MNTYRHAATGRLDIAYLEWNPQGARTAVLLHGWPDSAQCWKNVAPALAGTGYRVLAPALRGFAPTRFRDTATPRSGQLSALGRDLLDFIDALGIERPVLVGHDWGTRAVANACSITRCEATPSRRPPTHSSITDEIEVDALRSHVDRQPLSVRTTPTLFSTLT